MNMRNFEGLKGGLATHGSIQGLGAATAAPIILNVKGLDADSVPVLVSLAELERLHRLAGQVEGLAVLMPDKLGIVSDGASAG